MVDENTSPTIKHVAQAAGVSIATVSRVLNHSETVTETTRKRVLEVMENLGYNRNEVARALKFRQTRTIGIIAPELSNIFFMEVVEAMEQRLAPKGYSMIITSSNDCVEEEKRKLQILIERNVDGLVVMPAGSEGDHFLSKALSNIPLIMVDRRIKDLTVDSVETDNRYGVHQMVLALAQEGFTRIGFMGGDSQIHTAGERLAGFLEAMAAFGLPLEERFVLHMGAMNQAEGRALLKQVLQEPDHPQAFFIANDSMHLGATLQAMEMLDAEQLQHLVFASFDYLSYSPLLKLCHYAVCQPLERIGQEVADLLLKRLGGDWDDFPKQVTLRPEIKVLEANGGIPFTPRNW
ncbi:LacI family DNA-binding transcriptional regulator [Sphaerochaeta sp.]|uniref:LacI family DNA-binding transcriptional regulator n=1 Tax=Sphaerochaeta sp. TaxID=1972642 RepID=UPI002FCB6F58